MTDLPSDLTPTLETTSAGFTSKDGQATPTLTAVKHLIYRHIDDNSWGFRAHLWKLMPEREENGAE